MSDPAIAAATASSAPPRTGSNLDRLADRYDLGMELTSDEMAELTERVLEASPFLAADATHRITLESYVRVLEPHQLEAAVIDRAIEGLLHNRRQRLSNVIALKAHELERMLLGLLPRVDANFRADVQFPVPGWDRANLGVRYLLRADRGRFEVEVRQLQRGGIEERLFTLRVATAHRSGWWERWLLGRRLHEPQQVGVRAAHFAGTGLGDLLAWTLRELNGRTARGAAAGFALEHLHAAVLDEVDRAVQFVRTLEFQTVELSGDKSSRHDGPT